MIEADREPFAKLLAILAEVYGPASVLRMQAYWMALLPYELGEIEIAVLRCLRTRRSTGGYPGSWPTPGDLIALMYRQEEIADDVRPVARAALPSVSRDPASMRRIAALARQAAAALSGFDHEGEKKTTDPVLVHRQRLMARGLDESMAKQQAEALCHDPAHAADCLICRGGMD